MSNAQQEPFGGWFDYQKWYDLLAELMPDGGQFVELGVLQGASLKYFAEACKKEGKNKVKLYGVDVFDQRTAFGLDLDGAIEPLMASKKQVEEFLKEYKNIKLIQDLTHKAASQFQDESVDAVFVDGDHSYQGCSRDMAAWWPKLKPGGWMSGHDYGFGVEEAVNNFCRTWNLYDRYTFEHGNRCFVLRKTR